MPLRSPSILRVALRGAAFAAAAAAVAPAAFGETRLDTKDGDWHDEASWTFGLPEGNSKPAVISNGGTVTSSDGEALLGGMRLGYDGGSGTLVVAGGTAVTSEGTPNACIVAEDAGSSGTLRITGGEVTGGGFRLAHHAEGQADATISGGVLELISIAIGEGEATLTVSGGDIDLQMFNNPNPKATLTIEGGEATFDTQDYLAFGGKTVLRLGEGGLTTITGVQNINWSTDVHVEGSPASLGLEVGDSFFFLDWDGSMLNEEDFMALDGETFDFADGSEGEFIIDRRESRAAITINSIGTANSATPSSKDQEKEAAPTPAEPD